MLKTIAALLILVVWTPWCRAGEAVTMGFFNAKPHVMYDRTAKKVHGALITFLTNYIAPEMGIRFRWTARPFNVARQLEMIERGRLDGAALLVWSRERDERFLYTRNSFSRIRSVICVGKDHPLVRVDRAGDLAGMKIGSGGGTFITAFMRHSAIELIPVFTPEPNRQNLRKLISGRIDAMYIPDKAAILAELKDASMEGLVRIIELPEPSTHLHVVFGKGHENMVRRYDTAFDKINGARVYRQILGRYVDVEAL